MTSLKTRKLDISTILAVVKAQTGSGVIEPTSTLMAVLLETNTLGTESAVNITTRTPRQLNTIQYNSLGITLSGTPDWTFTIPKAGTYFFRATASFAFIFGGSGQTVGVNSRLFLNNKSQNVPEAISGLNTRANVSTTGPILYNNLNTYLCELSGTLVLSTTNTVFSLEQSKINTAASPTVNGGQPSNLGSNEIYASLEIIKLA